MREFKIGQSAYYHPRNRVKAEGRYVVMKCCRRPTAKCATGSEARTPRPASTRPKQTNCAEPRAMSLDGLAKYGHNIAWRENRQAYGVVWHQQE